MTSNYLSPRTMKQSSNSSLVDEISQGSEENRDRKLLRKVDLHLLPILTLLYLLSFLDRANIGNAKWFDDGVLHFVFCAPTFYLPNMKDIGVQGANYNTALALYFVGYVLWEVPANIVLKRFNPKVWLPTLTLAWGIVSICQGFVKNQAGLFAVRFFLGTTEAGLIFILEGIITVFIAIAAYWLVPNWPDRASFLTPEERERLIERSKLDSAGVSEQFRWSDVRQALGDHLVWAYALLFHGFAFVLYSLSLFLVRRPPTIIVGLGYASWEAQLLTVPPYALSAISIGVTVWLASIYNRRVVFIIGSAIIGIIGYILLLTTHSGAYTGNALLLSWPGEVGNHLMYAPIHSTQWCQQNVAPQTKRAVAVAMQISIGDLGAIAGVLIYRPEWSAHQFRKPHIISIGYLVFALAVAIWLWVWMARENRRRDGLIAGEEKIFVEQEHAEEWANQGDRHIAWRYHI
ncbi:transport protein [Ceratobasidium theobromae]|uniref:Transport protein n=1 Tax=Ceratobasidium theobromae TaxID=1582974 RepID=A0A5N5QGJ2_9AGAM|nr:transport protein [Ceratobasidium theobromae]